MCVGVSNSIMQYVCDEASVVGVLGRHGTLPVMRLACHHVKIHYTSFPLYERFGHLTPDPRGWLYCVLCVVN